MQDPNDLTLCESVVQQAQTLNEGQPIKAFDRFFAKGAQEVRRKQESYILSAKSICGLVIDLNMSEADEICGFRNQTSFQTRAGYGIRSVGSVGNISVMARFRMNDIMTNKK